MMDRTSSQTAPASKNILRLSFVSLLNDLGSEVLARLVPLFVTGVLGAPMSAVGMIEGLAESTATLLKPLFGSISDRLGKRKAFVTFGYALSAVSRPLLALARAWPHVAFLRFCDRLGKGVRTAPRDALIADSTIEGRHGKSFGINRSLDTVGALLGVGAFAIWSWVQGEQELTRQTWIWLCIGCGIPGLLAAALAGWGVTDVAPQKSDIGRPASETGKTGKLNPVLTRYLFVVALFSLANSSDAFILLRAKELGFALPAILGIIALFNLVSAMTSIPAAALSDRLGRRALIAVGWTIYAVTYGLMGSPLAAHGWLPFTVIVAVYGLFYGFTEGVERAWVADLVPSEMRGRAYGRFGLVVGLAALPASALFGWAWDRYGSEVPFYASSAAALVATAMLFALVPQKSREK
jgi:MFS family permease